MIKQKLLDSLKGLPEDQAKALVRAAGHKANSIPDGMAATLQLRPNTVMLWLDADGNVSTATSGEGEAE